MTISKLKVKDDDNNIGKDTNHDTESMISFAPPTPKHILHALKQHPNYWLVLFGHAVLGLVGETNRSTSFNRPLVMLTQPHIIACKYGETEIQKIRAKMG